MSAFVRFFGFFVKEIREVARQPNLVLVLILGPFLILLLFGLGYSATQPPLLAVMVVPGNVDLPVPREEYAKLFGPAIALIGATDNETTAIEMLRRRDIDVVVVIPTDLYDRLRRNEQATVRVVFNEIDPVMTNYIRFVAGAQTADLNAKILEGSIRRGLQQPGIIQALAGTQVSPEVIVSPLASRTEGIAVAQPSMVGYYAPAVLALLLQHIAVTFGALSIVRERLYGAMELFRVAPVAAVQILLGKYLAYLLLGGLITAVLTALLVFELRVPFIGDYRVFAAIMGTLILASTGYGFCLSLISQSERQAVQLAMLTLIASVFFSGFFLRLDTFTWPVRGVAYLLPATYGIEGLQDVMLRGSENYIVIGALAVLALLLFTLGAMLLKRELRSDRREDGARA